MKTQDMVRELLEVTERFNKTTSPQIDRDRISHATNIIYLASKIFSVAKNWLRTPNPYLGDLIPLNMLESAEGIEHVLDMLGRIDYGVYS